MKFRQLSCKTCRRSFRPTSARHVRCPDCRSVRAIKRGAKSAVEPPTIPAFGELLELRTSNARPRESAARFAIKQAQHTWKHRDRFTSIADAKEHTENLVKYAACAANGAVPDRAWQLSNLGYVINHSRKVA